MLKIGIRSATLFLVAALTACGGSSQRASADNAASEFADELRAPPEGWVEVRPEPNLSLLLREGWTADRAENGSGAIVFSGAGDARVMVWPLFVARGAKMPPPETILTDFAGKAARDMNWTKPEPFGREGVRMFGRSGDTVAQASLVYSKSDAGLAGYWYLTSAQEDQYTALQPDFAILMSGVRLYGPAEGASTAAPVAPKMQYVDWREPNEGAYTAKVPGKWAVRGGIVRPDPMRLLDIMDITSPDGKIYVFSGDPNAAIFKTPTQMEAQLGLVEGMRHGGAILMRYIPAATFLPQYIQNRFGQQCASVSVEKVEDQPEYAAQVNAQLAQSTMPGNYQRADIALAYFRCGADAVGFVQMATYITGTEAQYGTEGFGIWQVSAVSGFIAPEAQAGAATETLMTVLSSRVVNPEWQRSNAKMVSQIQQINRETANQLSAQITQRYAASQSTGASGSSTSSSVSDDLSRRWQNNTLDQTDVIDESTGLSYKVESGSNYYWINQQGTAITGTNTPSQPDTDFQQMTQLP